jgi:hypothetical protein
MAEQAARWVDELLPAVPVRWVLTARRWTLDPRADLLRKVDQVVVEHMSRWLARRAEEEEDVRGRGRTRVVSVVQPVRLGAEP